MSCLKTDLPLSIVRKYPGLLSDQRTAGRSSSGKQSPGQFGACVDPRSRPGPWSGWWGSAPGPHAEGCQLPSPFPQSAPYEVAARACGSDVRRVDLGCGSALVLRRGPVQLVSRGPVWEDGASLRDRQVALRRLARWPGVTIATLPEPMAGGGLLPLVTPLHHAIWRLGPDLRAGMAGKWRNRLVAAERAGVRVQRVEGARLMPRWQELVAIENSQRQARRYRAHPAAFSLALPVERLRLWHWRFGGAMAAAMGFVVHGAVATYHLGWAGPEARAKGVHGVMLTRAAEALWAEGVQWLDLGSVNDEEAPGLAHFKLGTGAALVRLGPTCLVLPG